MAVRPTLTDFERRILELAEAGRTVPDTARMTARSPKTVENAVTRLNKRLGTNSRLEAAAVARARGLLDIARSPADVPSFTKSAGRRWFTADEAHAIRGALRLVLSPDRQVRTDARDTLLAMNFVLGEWSHAANAFTPAQFDLLIAGGKIRVVDEGDLEPTARPLHRAPDRSQQ